MDPTVQRTINDAINYGAQVEFYASPDACLACRALLGKVFDPADAPIIPLPECQSPPCRCDYRPAYQDHCPQCGTPRAPGAEVCVTCGHQFVDAPPQPAPGAQPVTAQQGPATGLAETEALRIKVIVGRLIGVVIGLTIWWFAIRPSLGDNPLAALVTLGLVTFGGQYFGTTVVWSVFGGRR